CCKAAERPSDPARGTHGLQPRRDGRVRCSALGHVIPGNPISECPRQHCAAPMLMVRNHNWRLWKIQIQKQLSACLIHTEDIKHSIEWTPKPTHLPTAL